MNGGKIPQSTTIKAVCLSLLAAGTIAWFDLAALAQGGFLDENIGWVGGSFRGMYGTTDGGQTWNPVPSLDGTINRYERVGGALFTAGTRGILRYDARRIAHP